MKTGGAIREKIAEDAIEGVIAPRAFPEIRAGFPYRAVLAFPGAMLSGRTRRRGRGANQPAPEGRCSSCATSSSGSRRRRAADYHDRWSAD